MFFLDCRREIRDLRGAIESPNFPSNYINHANCEWKIVPPLGNRVFIEFSHFEVERSYSMDSEDEGETNCVFDHLTIEERDTSDAVIRSDKYCEKMPKPIDTPHSVILKYTFTYIVIISFFYK